MKKALILFLLLLTASFLLIGCSAKKEKADMNLEKAQKLKLNHLLIQVRRK